MSSERLKRLTNVLHKYVEDGRLPGGVALVARRGKVAYLEAFGQRDREGAARMPEDAIFRIASQTKALVSVGVMILQEEGRLLISDRVGKHLPEFLETTVRRLAGECRTRSISAYETDAAAKPVRGKYWWTHH